MEYNDKFDPETQLEIEERIASIIFDTLQGEPITEEAANELGKIILHSIVPDLRPDLVARKWIISDGNAAETHEDWELLLRTAEEWYMYLSEESAIDDDGMDIAVYARNFDDIIEGDLDSLNSAIKLWEERIAEAAGYTTFTGTGNYSVSAASRMGLNLTVREVEE
ncbi:MAG: hypothetical protein M0R80_04075 [Proteobacteria bacterium]|jgi:hypothetical protein|nr:hypothetical protein [Pseudomonadota bacterium]